jgi:hypothetical protein
MGEGLSRRDFFKTAARWLLVVGLGATAAKLLLAGKPRRAGETCVNDWVCRGCTAFQGCGLPQALSARQRAPWARKLL